jgi:hypothetical protein
MRADIPLFLVDACSTRYFKFLAEEDSMTCPKCHSKMLTHIVVDHNSPSAHGLSCFLCGYWMNGVTSLKISRNRKNRKN